MIETLRVDKLTQGGCEVKREWIVQGWVDKEGRTHEGHGERVVGEAGE